MAFEEDNNEDLQTFLLQMLHRLEAMSGSSKGEDELAKGPNCALSSPLLKEEDTKDGKRKEPEVNRPDEEATISKNPPSTPIIPQDDQEQTDVVVDKYADPLSEVPVNMINLTWAEKGKRKVVKEAEERKLVGKLAEGVNKLPEYPNAAIIRGMVLCSRCQSECQLEIPPAGVLIDQELIRRKEEERETREKARRVTEKNSSRNVFQRLGGDSQPKPLSEVFRDYQASEEVEDKEARRLKEGGMGSPQHGRAGKETRKVDRITHPVKKDNPAHLDRRWYVIGKDGQPTKPMGASMIRRVQRQHKAYMNSLKAPVMSETSKNQDGGKTIAGGSGQFQWRSKKEVERANSKTEGVGNHVPQNSHPGKYRILRRAREDMFMVPTPGWREESAHIRTPFPEEVGPSLPVVGPFGEVPTQMVNEGINQQEGTSQPGLPDDALAWLEEFMSQVKSKKEDFPEPNNFRINMVYVLSAIFGAEPGQPATMEGDYLTNEPIMARVNMEAVDEGESGEAGSSSEALKEGPERIYTDRMVFGRPNLMMANHLKPIYVVAHLEGVPFKRVLIDGGAAVNVLPARQMKRVGRGVGDLIPTDLTVSSFSGAITKTHGILPLEVDLGSKRIMLAFFVVDCVSTYGALLGRDWIHQGLAIPSTLHQQVAVYHEAGAEGSGFWEMVKAESRPFLPTANVAEASFYNPNVGILQCSGADKNGRPTKVTAQKLLEQGICFTQEEWDRPHIVPTPQHY